MSSHKCLIINPLPNIIPVNWFETEPICWVLINPALGNYEQSTLKSFPIELQKNCMITATVYGLALLPNKVTSLYDQCMLYVSCSVPRS